MQSDHSRASDVKVRYIDEIERHIENTLSNNWILRVEHTQEVNPVRTHWQQWGKALYCVKEAGPVIRSIQACRQMHPTHNIRLYAEKTSPRTRFIYPVYRPEGNTGTTQVLPGKWTAQASRRLGAWLEPVQAGAIAARSRIWRVITVTGVLLASLLAVEEVLA